MITCLIRKGTSEYYTGEEWSDGIENACLYSLLPQAEEMLKILLPRNRNAETLCVIQDKSFDYYDGEKFVYDLRSARLYRPQEAEEALKKVVF